MPFVAGNDVHGFCPKCKRDGNHTVMVVHDGLVQQVRCTECREVHWYQRPHTPARAPKRSKTRRTTTRKRAPRKTKAPPGPPEEWVKHVIGADPESFHNYSMKECYELNDLISHVKFGPGVVAAIRDDNKIEIAFQQGIKTLVHNR